jgi:hypothetical protein
MKIRSCKNLLLLLLVTGCNSQNRVDNSNKELANEIKQSQIKRVTNEQVISAIDLWGKELVKKAQGALVKEINAAKQPTSPLCEDLSKLPIIAAYETEYGISMGFLTPADSSNLGLDSKEKELLAAYQYSAQKKLPLNDNIQKLNDTLYVYNAAMAETQIANSCFPEQDFVLWRIIFDKRKVIQKIDIKKI